MVVAIVILLILAMIWREQNAWRSFEWSSLWKQARQIRLFLTLAGTGLIYAAFLLRAFRWKLLLRPMRQTSVRRILGPTVVGFTALALLGRPGELVRPYLLARRERLSVSSQLGIWMVERFFDITAFGTLFLVSVLVSPDLRRLPYFGDVRHAFLTLAALAAVLAGIVLLLYRRRARLVPWAEKLMDAVLRRFRKSPTHVVQSFVGALKTMKRTGEFLEIAGVSVAMWGVIACAYWSVIRSLPSLNRVTFPYVVLLMAFSMVGSLVQLPGAGGAQLITIAVLVRVFGVQGEVAVACGALLWVATYMAPVPAGLLLLHHYGLSLRKVSHDSQERRESSGGGSSGDYFTRTEAGTAGASDEGTGF
jgi:glycosyltransferase 2 family protein